MNSRELVALATGARNVDDVRALDSAIVAMVGARFERPIGETGNNIGMLTGSGASFDHKLLEGVTNMMDAVIERRALARFGDGRAVPFSSPRDAVKALFAGEPERSRAEMIRLTLEDSSSAGAKAVGAATVVMRDTGCGLTPAQLPRTLFRVGSTHKDGKDWLHGTFGLGGLTMYRNAKAVVIVTRRDPALLAAGDEDSIAIALVQWQRVWTTTDAYYLVDAPWDEDDPYKGGIPIAVPAAQVPDFEVGTQLTLIGYESKGLAKRSGDEHAFDILFNTRMYRPALPLLFDNRTIRPKAEVLRGLEQRLADNPVVGGRSGAELMPFRYGGVTYQLPFRFQVFNVGDKGSRRRYVAYGHGVMILANGQVHRHWTPSEFRERTTLKRVAERVMIVVDADPLPVELRALMFTADRADTAKIPVAVKLEDEIFAFIDQCTPLDDINSEMVRAALNSGPRERSTLQLAEKISRAFKIKGIGVGGIGPTGGKRRPPKPLPPELLYADPTHLEVPASVELVAGETKGFYAKLNARDGFLGAGGKSELHVSINHPDFRGDDIAIGNLSAGRIRVSVAVPATDELGEYALVVKVDPWLKTAGGAHPGLEVSSVVRVVAERSQKPSGRGSTGLTKGKSGAGEDGPLVAMMWDPARESGDVGEIEEIAGHVLADSRPEYEALRQRKELVPTVVLNPGFGPLKQYLQGRTASKADSTLDSAQERYAVGVGVGLLVLDANDRSLAGKGGALSAESRAVAARACARGVLSVLPDYDALAKETLGE